MQEFDAIRPYRDDEVADVVARLIRDPKLLHVASRLMLPKVASLMPSLGRWLTARILTRRTRSFQSVGDLQEFLVRYMGRFVEETISVLTVTGLDALDDGRPFLLISNHRDIFMDTALVNFTLYQAGMETLEAAVGDNLLAEPYAADLMRLNKSFVIERSVSGKRAVYRSLTRTSHYIRHTLEAGNSVWIAQREGRSKDGFDRTDPAVLKMLALAYRKDVETFTDLLEKIRLVPVSISYELDPCDLQKARELYMLDRYGSYEKAADEDLLSIVAGLTGTKGRVHLHFSEPMHGHFEGSDDLALALDKAIVEGLEVFPTQAWAARELEFPNVPETADWLPEVQAAFLDRVEQAGGEREFLLAGYGNLIRNRNELEL